MKFFQRCPSDATVQLSYALEFADPNRSAISRKNFASDRREETERRCKQQNKLAESPADSANLLSDGPKTSFNSSRSTWAEMPCHAHIAIRQEFARTYR
jgi:hypothetical protein